MRKSWILQGMHIYTSFECKKNDTHSFHTHGPNTSIIEMFKEVNKMKARADKSDESTRLISASGIETMTDSTIPSIVKLD